MKTIEVYDILHNQSEIEKFYDKFFDIDNPIKENEVLSLSLASRSKYATREERDTLYLNRTIMLERSILRGSSVIDNKNLLIRALKSWEKYVGYHTIESKHQNNLYYPIPETTFVSYMFLNPMSAVKTFKTLKNKIENINNLGFDSFIDDKRNKDVPKADILFELKRLDKMIAVTYTHSESDRRWFDIDIDFDNEKLISLCHYDTSKYKDPYEYIFNEYLLNFINKEFLNRLFNIKESKIEYNLEIFKKNLAVVQTIGGFHFCFRTFCCKIFKRGPESIIEKLKEIFENTSFKEAINEIKKNDICQIPIPGTLQGGFEVKLIY